MADEPWGLFQKAVGGGGENWVCWVVWPQRKVRFLPGPPRAHGPREAAGSPEIPVFPTLRLCPCRGLPGLGEGVPWVCRGLLAFSMSQLWLTPHSALQRGAGRVPRSWPPQEGGWQSTSVPPAPGRPWPQGWEPLVLASPAGVSSGCGPEPGSWNVAGADTVLAAQKRMSLLIPKIPGARPRPPGPGHHSLTSRLSSALSCP